MNISTAGSSYRVCIHVPTAAKRMDAVLSVLENVEKERLALHQALREALFALGVAQSVEECKGAMVNAAAIPMQSGRVVPSFILEYHSRSGTNKLAEEGVWEPVMLDQASSPIQAAPASATEGAQLLTDPLSYFSRFPSQELRDCQAAFRAVLHRVVQTATAQQRALREADEYARRTSSSPE